MRPLRLALSAAALLGLAVAAGPAAAELPAERTGGVETLPAPDPHQVWVADVLLQRSALVDLDSGRFLGMINGGYGTLAPLFPEARREIYLPATYYSRLTRGQRTDVVTIYDGATLAPVDEVEIPPKRAIDAVAVAHSALSDDDRFLAVFNLTPTATLSVVDVERRAFVGEVSLPGCALVYAAGPRRFLSLCTDGSALVVELDGQGREASRARTPKFFDPRADPVTEKAVRHGDRWLFVSFEGYVHPLDVSGDTVVPGERWSLLDDDDRADAWRIGGLQHLAVHPPSGRLYSLVHQGGPDTHKENGEEVWVYDLDARERILRIELRNPGLTIFGVPLEFGRDWAWPLSGLSPWLLDTFVPAGVGQIAVTRDDAPLLVTATQWSGSLAVYDALDGAFLRRVQGVNMTSDIVQTPFGGGAGR